MEGSERSALRAAMIVVAAPCHALRMCWARIGRVLGMFWAHAHGHVLEMCLLDALEEERCDNAPLDSSPPANFALQPGVNAYVGHS